MEKKFINKWNINKDKLKKYFEQTDQSEYSKSYESLLEKVISIVFNDENRDFETNIQTIDYGHYQGTLILCFTEDDYQPSINDTYYTSVYYGSCSGCDTLQEIRYMSEEDLANEQQISGYMTLCLHMVQKIKSFGNDD